MISVNHPDSSIRYTDKSGRVRGLKGPKVDSDGRIDEVVTADGSGNVAVTGALTVTGSSALPSTAGPTSGALTAAMSGRLCIGVVDAVYTLPAPTAGVWYTIVTGVASAGTGLVITATSTLIQGKTTSAGTTAITDATSITNSGASDVVGDYVTIRSDGTKWWVVGQSGTYAGS